jgi:Tol biopolymer transport system component
MKKTISLVLVVLSSMAVENANADFTFGTPINLGPVVNSSSSDWTPSISADGLELFFCSDRSGGYGSDDLWVAKRETTDDDWGTPTNLGPPVNTSNWEQGPSISADGLSLFFSSYNRPGGAGGDDIYVTTRATTDDPWSTPVNLGPKVNSSSEDWTPSISADGLELFFTSTRSGGYGGRDLWVTTRETTDDEWQSPVNLGPTVNSTNREITMSISHDGLLLFFGSDRPGGSGRHDLWLTRRETTDDAWGTPVNLGPTVNSSAQYDQAPNISADGSTLFFYSDREGGVGGGDIYQAPVIPIVDLNTDGIVDCADMCIMIDCWGTNEPLCDIGPMPWGDGIVDVQDLIVLAEHLFEEIPAAEPVE